ncbi:MAG: TIGR04282 family arsenosugar biosynthesis glycosyltransferase [Pseudolabrys sp.]
MAQPNAEPVSIAILAKAPVAGLAKTRLIPALGAHGAAVLAERFIERGVATAIAADVGPVVLWATPEPSHRCFRDLAAQCPLTLATQPAGDLGARMLAAIQAANGPVIVIGTDCPALAAEHLRQAAAALRDGHDVVIAPAEDGGYVLIAAARPCPELMTGMAWSTAQVMAQTRARAARHGLRLHELPMLWDVDEPADLDRLEQEFPDLAP